jgi:GNAT superfamily N-acetyltransferase
MVVSAPCTCEVEVEAENAEAFPDVFLRHVRAAHPDWPFLDLTVQVVGEALLRLTGSAERLEAIGVVGVEPVMPDHLDDWLSFFDHDAFVDRPWVAGCYCLEQHARPLEPGLGVWRDTRAAMVELLQAGRSFGYLAYVDGRPAGWVNASLRAGQIYALGTDGDRSTVTVSCFNIAPPYRGHRLAGRMLDRVVADAPARGATRVEAYPPTSGDEWSFRGSLGLYESRGFETVKDLGPMTLVRLELTEG